MFSRSASETSSCVTSYDHQLHFGLTGCRRTVPHLQRLLTQLEVSLADLENIH